MASIPDLPSQLDFDAGMHTRVTSMCSLRRETRPGGRPAVATANHRIDQSRGTRPTMPLATEDSSDADADGPLLRRQGDRRAADRQRAEAIVRDVSDRGVWE